MTTNTFFRGLWQIELNEGRMRGVDEAHNNIHKLVVDPFMLQNTLMSNFDHCSLMNNLEVTKHLSVCHV